MSCYDEVGPRVGCCKLAGAGAEHHGELPSAQRRGGGKLPPGTHLHLVAGSQRGGSGVAAQLVKKPGHLLPVGAEGGRADVG